MALVIKQPEEDKKKIYLECVLERATARRIKCGKLQKDVSIKIGKYELKFKRGDYVMFYGDKPETVEELGKKLRRMGYHVNFIDALTIAIIYNLEKILG